MRNVGNFAKLGIKLSPFSEAIPVGSSPSPAAAGEGKRGRAVAFYWRRRRGSLQNSPPAPLLAREGRKTEETPRVYCLVAPFSFQEKGAGG